MAKLLDSFTFTFECHPTKGHYYPTVGKDCSSEAEYQREADRTKRQIEKDTIQRLGA